MMKRTVIRAISDCTDPRDHKAGIGDICLALGKVADQAQVDRITKMLRDDYSAYVAIVTDGGCVVVKTLTHAASARYDRRYAQLLQWLLAIATAIAATLLGFFLGKYFG